MTNVLAFTQNLSLSRELPVRIVEDPTDVWDVLTAIGTLGAVAVAALGILWTVRQSRKEAAPNVLIGTALTPKGLRLTITNGGTRAVTIDRVMFFGSEKPPRPDGKPGTRDLFLVDPVEFFHGDKLPKFLVEGESIGVTYDVPSGADILHVYDSVGRAYASYVNPFLSGLKVGTKRSTRARAKVTKRAKRSAG